MAQIQVTNLTFSYDGSSDTIFDKMSFTLDTDWKLGLIGRNGKGKTTFLNLLLGRYEYMGTIRTSTVFDYFPYQIPGTWETECGEMLLERMKPVFQNLNLELCQGERVFLHQDISLWQEVDILPDLSILDKLLRELLPGQNTNSMDFIEDVLKGNWVLDPGLFWRYIANSVTSVIDGWKRLFVSVLVLFILVALVSNLMSALKNEGAAKAARTFFIICQLVVLIDAFHSVLGIVNDAMEQMIEFLKLMIPAYMICIAAAGSGLTALIFYKLLLGFLCLIEGIMAASLTTVVEGYVMLGVVESIWGEERFKGLMELMKKGIQWVLKMMVVLISGSSILQVIITPVIDKANNTVIQKTAGAIPGIGDIVESVSSVTLASAIAVKNSLGVLILVVIVLLIAAPVLKAFMILLIIKVSGALGSICGEKQMMKCIEYISEAGFMLLRILITVTTLFFVTIAAVTNATS